jgi:hypothetical protein
VPKFGPQISVPHPILVCHGYVWADFSPHTPLWIAFSALEKKENDRNFKK